MRKFNDLTGEVFGRLTVIERAENDKRRKTMWKCQCKCGKEVVIPAPYLKSGDTKSCGCLRIEQGICVTKHGLSNHSLYKCYEHMISRCYNPNSKGYHNYGGRGIIVCDRWRESFANFYEDMGDRPSSEHTLDRIDNSKDYCPGNCQWSTQEEQARNKRTNRYVTLNGQRMIYADAAKNLGITRERFTRAMQQLRKGKMPAIFSKVGDFSLEYL